MSKRKRKKSAVNSSARVSPRVIMAAELSTAVAELVKLEPQVGREAVRPPKQADKRPNQGRAVRSSAMVGSVVRSSAMAGSSKKVASSGGGGGRKEEAVDEFALPAVEKSNWEFGHDSSPDFTYLYGGRLKVAGDGSSLWPESAGVYDPHDMSRGLVAVVGLNQPYWIEDSISFDDVK